MLYSDMVCIYKTDLYFNVMLYNIFYSFRCEIRVYFDYAQLCSSSSILLVLSFLSHPLISSINGPVFSMSEQSTLGFVSIFGVENAGSLQEECNVPDFSTI